MRKIDEHLMSTAIAANPFKDAASEKEFVENLLGQRRFYRGEVEVAEILDVAAFESFRDTINNGSKLIKAK